MDDGLGSGLKFDSDMGSNSRRRMNRGADGKFESANYNEMMGMSDYPMSQSGTRYKMNSK